jgi:hypothetical protein
MYRIYYPAFDYTDQETYNSIQESIDNAKWTTYHILDERGNIVTGKGNEPLLCSDK